MRTASDVKELVAKWIAEGKDKSYIVVNAAEACMGWPYVWGAVGSDCSPSRRQYYAGRDVCPDGEKKVIINTCQALNGSGKSCGGCKWYPDNMRTLCNDCQGFCKNIFSRVGITLPGAGATSMYNTASAFTERGKIADMPNVVCLVFMQSGDKMSHAGIHIGNGDIIHCSGTVKRGKITDRGWTHYAVPKGMSGNVPTTDKPTLRRGSSGEYVTLLQTKLIQLGYDVGATGADGKFGDKTAAAVRMFQRDHGLVQDGVVGKNTWAALEEGKKELYTVTVQHISKTVAESIINTYGGTMKKEG